MKIDLKSLSRKELEKLANDVQKALTASKERDKRDALKAAEKAVAEFGFSLNELAAKNSTAPREKVKTKKSKPAKPRFANPEDPDQTWTGKGRQPFWFKKAIEGGISADSMEL